MKIQKRKHLSGSSAYYTHVPLKIGELTAKVDIPPKILEELESLFEELRFLLSELDGEIIPAIVDQEAKDSVLLAEGKTAGYFSYISLLGNPDVENIKQAYWYSVDALDELPISSRLIRHIHHIVCRSDAYDKKYPGEFRSSPVWIGNGSSTLTDAVFVPPAGRDMTDAMSELDNYINYSSDNPYLMAAVIHYQFEMIHPFIDGNGRVGRILNNLFLFEKGEIPHPAFLLSSAIIENRGAYFDALQRVNETGDFNYWLRYFLDVLKEGAQLTIDKVKNKDPQPVEAYETIFPSLN